MSLYFAYGSNMDRDAMAARCPGSHPLGVARLARHRLVVMREGYLSVVRDPRLDVPGVLWRLALADMPALDRYEEVAGGLYWKRQLAVIGEAGPRQALVYIGSNAGPGAPRPGYLEGVLDAARRAGLPARHLEAIAALGPSRGGAADRAGDPPARPAVQPLYATPLGRARTDQRARPWTP